MPDILELYRDNILSYAKKRNFFYPLASPTHSCDGRNPLCGDEIVVSVRVENGKLMDIALDGESCAIARASANIMVESVKGLSVDEALVVCDRVDDLLDREKEPDIAEIAASEILWSSLIVIRDHPARLKCATLAWTTLREALKGEHTATTE